MRDWLAGLCSVWLAASASAGSLELTTVSPSMEWEPGCPRPLAPSPVVYEIGTFSEAMDTFNAYVSAVEDYLDCLGREAQADLGAVAKSIADSLDRRSAQVLRDLNGARSELLSRRRRLREGSSAP